MSIISQIVDAIRRIEGTVGLKTDINTDTVFGRLNRLETDLFVHNKHLGNVTVVNGTNAFATNPVVFDSITVEENAQLTIYDENFIQGG